MQFKDIPGKEALKQALCASVRTNQIGHAQLFTGLEGCGLLPMALAYSQYINCENRTETDSCGHCISCREISKLAHPDVHFAFPVASRGKSSSEKPISDMFLAEWREQVLKNPFINLFDWMETLGTNIQGNISAQESNAAIHKLNLKTFQSEYRILIVWHAERMNVSASNKLLKIIEEPLEKTLILFLTHSPEQLPATIISRLRRVRVAPFSEVEIKNFLNQEKEIEREKAAQIAHNASGNMHNALRMIDDFDDSFGQTFDKFAQWMRCCFLADIIKMLDFSSDLSKLSREQLKSFLLYGIELFRNCLLHNYITDDLVKATNDENKFINNFSAYINNSNAASLVAEFEEAIKHIERNGNAKIVLFDLSIKVTQLLKLKEKLNIV